MATGVPTDAIYAPYSPSDGTEGPVLRDFVNETLAATQGQPGSQRSPRSELLSTAQPSNSNNTPFSSQDVVARQRDLRPRRGPTQRYRREREAVYQNTPPHELLRLLIEHEYEASKMRKTLYLAFSELETQTQRAAAAEKQSQDTAAQFQRINESRLALERESRILEEELTLYKIQYDLAQKEILKARETVIRLTTELGDAESVARKARGDARKVKEAMGIWRAREEGRRQGFEDGWRRAREEIGIVSGRPALGFDDDIGGVVPPPAALSVQRSETQGNEDDDDFLEHIATPQRHEQPVQLPEVPLVPRYGTNIPPSALNQNPSIAPSYPPFNPPPPNHQMPEPPTLSQTPPPRAPSRSTVGMRTPAIQTYALEIPPADQVEFDNRPSRSNSRKHPPRSWRPEAPMQRRSPSPQPPINYIPSLSDDGRIPLPPPHEMAGHPPSPQPEVYELPGPSSLARGLSLDGGGRRDPPAIGTGKAKVPQSWYNRGRAPDARAADVDGSYNVDSAEPQPSSWYQPKGSASPVRSRDFAYRNPSRDRLSSFNSGHSRNSGSVSTQYSKMDLLNVPGDDNPPPESKRPGGFGSTLKNMFRGKGKDRELSMIKESSLSRQGSLNVAPQAPQQPFEALQNPWHSTAMDPELNQRFADNLRYDDPAEVERVEEWRSESHPDPLPTRDRPPRNVRMPAELTVPAPLSPRRALQSNVGHSRSMSMGSFGSYQDPPPNASPRGSANPSAGSRPSGRFVSMSGSSNNNVTSPPVAISVQSPSQSPSDAPAALSANGSARRVSGTPNGLEYLSPNYSTAPLPHDRSRSPSAPYGDGRPSQLNGLSREASENSTIWPPTERPSSRTAGGSFNPNGTMPFRYPVVGQQEHSRSATPTIPHGTSDHHSSHTRTPSRAAQQPLPTSRPASAASSRPSHRPSNTVHGGETPSFLKRPLPDSSAHLRSNSVDPHQSIRRINSSTSVGSGSYSHFDPESYRDPAFFAADSN